MTFLEAEKKLNKARSLAINEKYDEALKILLEIDKLGWIYVCDKLDEAYVFNPLKDNPEFQELIAKQEEQRLQKN
jgi:hypothetical protein